MPLTLRSARPEDAAAMLEIYAPFIRDSATTFEVEVPSVADFRKRVETISARRPWIVAVDENQQIIGYAYGSEHRARIAYQWATEVSVYIREGSRRGGVGRLLYTRLFKLLRTQGFYTALAGITLPHPASVGFHESFGFKPIGIYRAIGYKLGAWHDVGWWQLELQAPTLEPEVPGQYPSTF